MTQENCGRDGAATMAAIVVLLLPRPVEITTSRSEWAMNGRARNSSSARCLPPAFRSRSLEVALRVSLLPTPIALLFGDRLAGSVQLGEVLELGKAIFMRSTVDS